MNAQQFDKAVDLLEAERFKEAEPLFQDLHDQEPLDARINYSLGLIYSHFNELDRALSHLVAASQVATEKSIVFSTLAFVQGRLFDYDSQLMNAKKAMGFDPKSSHARSVLGDAYYHLRRPVLARQTFETLLRMDPQSVPARLGLHKLDMSLGVEDEADAYLKEAAAIDPDNPDVLLALADRPNLMEELDYLPRFESALGDDTLPGTTRAKLSFAVAKHYDRQDDRPKAFQYFAKHRDDLYDRPDMRHREFFQRASVEIFTKDFFEKRKNAAFQSAKPVFVFGMPRSGTTLAEQIIARHPKAAAAGEQTYFSQIETRLRQGRDITPMYFTNILDLTRRDVKRMGRGYLSVLDGISKKADRVVDKMPHNFESLWLLALLFPNASFIHMTRSPIDTCLSIYTTPLNGNHRYNIDQKTLGEYYRYYWNMMNLWRAMLPITIRDQSYEALVADQETETRALLEHIGLEWDDACLQFQDGTEQVFTFSRDQVRRPIYTSSIGKWRNYEPQIKPLVEALGPLAAKGHNPQPSDLGH
ncbi:MAG: sulfotransferase [Roseibium sp.]|nr:sulfotransferase [Roseibium sp.]